MNAMCVRRVDASTIAPIPPLWFLHLAEIARGLRLCRFQAPETYTENKQHLCKTNKTCVTCNALRLPPPAYHMRKQTKQCTRNVLHPPRALSEDRPRFTTLSKLCSRSVAYPFACGAVTPEVHA